MLQLIILFKMSFNIKTKAIYLSKEQQMLKPYTFELNQDYFTAYAHLEYEDQNDLKNSAIKVLFIEMIFLYLIKLNLN